MTDTLVHHASPSMICAGCDSRLVITKDAVGNERLRCPRCQGVSSIRPHPDDAMLPQGLVRVVAELPAIEPGQLRCQVCARGVSGNARFHRECLGVGQLLVQALRNERNHGTVRRHAGEAHQ